MSSPAQTISFIEKNNCFDSFLSYTPEMMCTLGDLLVSYKDGQAWTHDNPIHNNFYGVQYESTVTVVFNINALQKKQPIALTEVANTKWDAPAIETDTNSFGTTKQASLLLPQDISEYEGQFEGALLRDINSQKGILNGDFLKGSYTKIKLRVPVANTGSLVTLSVASLKWNNSTNNAH